MSKKIDLQGTFENFFEIGAADDFKLVFRRNGVPLADLDLTWPPQDGSVNQALVTDGAGNLSFFTVTGANGMVAVGETLTFATAAGMNDIGKILPANAVPVAAFLYVDTAFDGPLAVVKYGITAGGDELLPEVPGVLQVAPGGTGSNPIVIPTGVARNITRTFTPDGSIAGSARFLTIFGVPA